MSALAAAGQNHVSVTCCSRTWRLASAAANIAVPPASRFRHAGAMRATGRMVAWTRKPRWPSLGCYAMLGRVTRSMPKASPEALDDHRLQVDGFLVDVAQWDAVMREPCGVWWDKTDEADILARGAIPVASAMAACQ